VRTACLEGLEQDFDPLLEHLAVGVLVQQRRAEGLDLPGVVAAPDAEDDTPAGQDVGHRIILGEVQRMPHRHDVEAAAMFMFLVTPHRCIAIIKRFGINSVPSG
jgi:hypothetical protein